jgi:hypothetical protein
VGGSAACHDVVDSIVDDVQDAWCVCIVQRLAHSCIYAYVQSPKPFWYALQVRGVKAHGIMVARCSNVTLTQITMHNVGMFFIIDWNGNANRVRIPARNCFEDLARP